MLEQQDLDSGMFIAAKTPDPFPIKTMNYAVVTSTSTSTSATSSQSMLLSNFLNDSCRLNKTDGQVCQRPDAFGTAEEPVGCPLKPSSYEQSAARKLQQQSTLGGTNAGSGVVDLYLAFMHPDQGAPLQPCDSSDATGCGVVATDYLVSSTSDTLCRSRVHDMYSLQTSFITVSGASACVWHFVQGNDLSDQIMVSEVSFCDADGEVASSECLPCPTEAAAQGLCRPGTYGYM